MWKDCFSSLILKLCDAFVKVDDFWNHFAFDDPCFAAQSQVSQQPCCSYRDDLCIQQRLREIQLLYQQRSSLDLYIPVCFPCIPFDFLWWPVSLHGEQMWHFSCVSYVDKPFPITLSSLSFPVCLSPSVPLCSSRLDQRCTHTHTHSVNKHIKMPNKTALNSSGGREAGRKRRMNRKARAVGHQIRRQSRGGKTELFRGVHVNEFEQSPLMMSLHSQRQSKARWYWAACSMHYCAHKMFINERTPALRFFTHQREVKSSLYIVILWFRLFFHIRNIHSLHGV